MQHPLLHFNFGVVLVDLDKPEQTCAPTTKRSGWTLFADAHVECFEAVSVTKVGLCGT